MAGTITRYFAGGNTSRGFYSLFESNLSDLDRLFILKGGPGTGKSSIIKRIAKHWNDAGYDVEVMHCSSDSESLDGVIIPAIRAGIVDGTSPHVIEPKAPGAVEEYVNLGKAWNRAQLTSQRDIIKELSAQVSEAFQAAYQSFSEALSMHDQWERVYIRRMNFAKADRLASRWMERLFGEEARNKDPVVRHRFLGAATPTGPVDFVPNLTAGVARRYLLKGRPGTGKSTLLKKVAAAAMERGFDTEIYHCGFDPDSLDMVIVRELDFAIFDSTAPHAYEAERESDEVIDLYALTVEPGTDEKYADEIELITKEYRKRMQEGTAFLAKAKEIRDGLEGIYVDAMDFRIVDELAGDIQAELQGLERALN